MAFAPRVNARTLWYRDSGAVTVQEAVSLVPWQMEMSSGSLCAAANTISWIAYCYCGDHVSDYNVIYIQGTGGKLTNMDIDCDGKLNHPFIFNSSIIPVGLWEMSTAVGHQHDCI